MGKLSYEPGEEHGVWFAEAERIFQERPVGTVLSEAQRRFYFEHGYLLVEDIVGPEWLARLRAVRDRVVEAARPEHPDGESKDFIVEPGHRPEAPRLTRLNNPVDWDQTDTVKEFCVRGPVLEVAKDLLGPDVRYHHSKLNFKWHSGGEEIAWHQDITGWPHSNYSPLTIGVYLEDVDDLMGPLGVIPNSHLGPLYPETPIKPEDLQEVDLTRATYLPGRAGSLTVHNSRMIHGSLPNNHPTRARPLLLQVYSAANAVPLVGAGVTPLLQNWGSVPGRSGLRLGGLVAGRNPAKVVFDPRPCPTHFIPEDQLGRPLKPSFLVKKGAEAAKL